MNKRLAFLIDTRYCNNCKTCEIACKMERKLAIGERWRAVRRFEKENSATADTMGNNANEVYNVSMSCNHCAMPQCVAVCPQEAYQKMPNGIVIQDYGKCIGCTKCIGACPYSAPVFNKVLKKTAKCDMCYARIEAGLQPSCVQTCPNGALKLDTYENLVARYGVSQDLGNVDNSLIPSGSETNPSIVIVKYASVVVP